MYFANPHIQYLSDKGDKIRTRRGKVSFCNRELQMSRAGDQSSGRQAETEMSTARRECGEESAGTACQLMQDLDGRQVLQLLGRPKAGVQCTCLSPRALQLLTSAIPLWASPVAWGDSGAATLIQVLVSLQKCGQRLHIVIHLVKASVSALSFQSFLYFGVLGREPRASNVVSRCCHLAARPAHPSLKI